MQNQSYQKTIRVQQFQCDLRDRMKPSALMAQCQEISTDHCTALGLTRRSYRETNTAFLLAKASLELYRDIQVEETLTLTTTSSGPHRAVYSRYTTLHNGRGELAAAMDTRWVLVDLESRRILRTPPQELHFPFVEQPQLPQHSFSIPKLQTPQLQSREQVTYSRTDCNGHLNNTVYADLICDLLPLEELCSRRLKRLQIHYHNEARLGQWVDLALEAHPGEGEQTAYCCCGVREDGKKCFEALAVLE